MNSIGISILLVIVGLVVGFAVSYIINRVKTKGIAIEIKNLDYSCLEKEYLDKILEELKISNLR